MRLPGTRLCVSGPPRFSRHRRGNRWPGPLSPRQPGRRVAPGSRSPSGAAGRRPRPRASGTLLSLAPAARSAPFPRYSAGFPQTRGVRSLGLTLQASPSPFSGLPAGAKSTPVSSEASVSSVVRRGLAHRGGSLHVSGDMAGPEGVRTRRLKGCRGIWSSSGFLGGFPSPRTTSRRGTGPGGMTETRFRPISGDL